MALRLPFDPHDPPAEPPAGCADPLLWRVAYALRRAHQARSDGWCDCREFHPCPSRALADGALRQACRRRVVDARRAVPPASANGGRW